MIAIALLTARLIKATEEDDDKPLRWVKYLCGTQKIGLALDGGQGIALEAFAWSTPKHWTVNERGNTLADVAAGAESLADYMKGEIRLRI